jgi:hypothetical protein
MRFVSTTRYRQNRHTLGGSNCLRVGRIAKYEIAAIELERKQSKVYEKIGDINLCFLLVVYETQQAIPLQLSLVI